MLKSDCVLNFEMFRYLLLIGKKKKKKVAEAQEGSGIESFSNSEFWSFGLFPSKDKKGCKVLGKW